MESIDAQPQETSQDANSSPAAPSAPRRPGRAPGLGKVPGSGRKKGTLGITNDLRMAIEVKGRPIEFLCKVVAGQRIRTGPVAGPGKAVFEYPSLNQRIRAAELLAAKIIPDIRAVEHSGPNGAPLPSSTIIHNHGVSEETARNAILSMLPRAVRQLVVDVTPADAKEDAA